MLFTSLEFLFLFLPVVLGVYYAVWKTVARNYWLLAASLFFYAWGEPTFVLAMLASIVFNYFFALVVAKARTAERMDWAKGLLTVAIVGNLSLLFVYKYLNFVTETLRTWIPLWEGFIPQTSFVLPIGISFFTFQAMSYVIDVYRGIAPQKNPATLGLYIALFPQLIAGPIIRYSTIHKQLLHRTHSFDLFSNGVLRFLYGFNKKVILANLCAVVADQAFGGDGTLSVGMAWLGAICYTLQIYFDFSGYSEMAIGLGMMFGFRFPSNFNYPYIAKTATEFWRRWHISLGTWFRDYVYFPLGGSRVKTKSRLAFNLFFTWFITGIWHGANWTFLVWGALYGTMITVEKLLSIPKREWENRPLRVFYQTLTLFAVVIGWVVFRAETLTDAWHYLATMFCLTEAPWKDLTMAHAFQNSWIILLAGIFCSTPMLKHWTQRLAKHHRTGAEVLTVGGYLLQAIFFIVSLSFLVMNAHNPFIYFNF